MSLTFDGNPVLFDPILQVSSRFAHESTSKEQCEGLQDNEKSHTKKSLGGYFLAAISNSLTACAPASRMSRFLGISLGLLANVTRKASA